VTAHFHEQGSVLGGTKEGHCDGIEIEFSLESDEPSDTIAELARAAHRMCFTEDALTQRVTLTKTHLLNGQALEL
jgi:hypothetical protein